MGTLTVGIPGDLSSSMKISQAPGLEGLVDDTPFNVVNPLAKREYVKTGCNEHFQVTPSIVHYGGYDIGCVHRTTVRVKNVTDRSKRLHILQPKTPFFKTKCEKRGVIAPGMSEEIKIEFCPTEWRYYYDCIRVHSESENLLIPIHAYPVMNDVLFPVRLDFGKCATDHLYTKTVKLECKVPIQFEFSISPLDPAMASTVWMEPSSGIVPADGALDVKVHFHPMRLKTYSVQFVVNIAQFNADPLTCTITGSGFPGKDLEKGLNLLAAGAKGTDRLGAKGSTMNELAGTREAPPFRPGAEHEFHLAGGGAGHGDHYTRLVDAEYREARATTRPAGPIQVKRRSPSPPMVEVDFRGVKLPPAKLHTQAGVQAVLLQHQGKLRMKDLKEVIDANNKTRRRQEAAVASGAGASVGLGWIDDEEMAHQLKEMIFSKEYNLVVDAEKEKELKFNVAPGGEEPTEDEITALTKARDECKSAKDAQEKFDNMHRYSKVVGAGPKGPAQLRGSHVANEDPIAGYSPDFDIYKNNDWARRTQILNRFKSAVRSIVVQRRAMYRLSKVKELVNMVGGSKQKVRDLCNEVIMGVRTKQQEETVALETKLRMDDDIVRGHSFPTFLKSNFKDRSMVDTGELPGNEIWEPLPLKVPMRFSLMGFEEQPYPPFPVYVDLRTDQPLMQGAEEEEDEWKPRALLPPDIPTMPQELVAPSRVTFPPLAERMIDDPVMSPAFPLWGVEDPYRIHPQEYTFPDTITREVSGSNSLLSLMDVRTLSDIWLPRREDWLMYKPPMPKLMRGPAEEDMMQNDPGFEPHPHIPVPKADFPTAESIRRMFYVPKAGEATAPAEREALEREMEEEKEEMEEVEEEEEEERHYEVPRQRKEIELDRMKREQRDAWVAKVLEEKEAFNTLISDPRYQFEIEHPGYPARPTLS